MPSEPTTMFEITITCKRENGTGPLPDFQALLASMVETTGGDGYYDRQNMWLVGAMPEVTTLSVMVDNNGDLVDYLCREAAL